MTLADEIRAFVLRTYIEPARRTGQSTVKVRAGDAHKAMGLKDRLPAVVSALGTLKFESYANVERIAIHGPVMGASTTFTFRIL